MKKSQVREQTFKLIMSLVSPGCGLTVVCFSLPFSVNEHVKLIMKNLKIERKRSNDLPLEIGFTCSTNPPDLMKRIGKSRLSYVRNPKKHHSCGMTRMASFVQFSNLTLQEVEKLKREKKERVFLSFLTLKMRGLKMKSRELAE